MRAVTLVECQIRFKYDAEIYFMSKYAKMHIHVCVWHRDADDCSSHFNFFDFYSSKWSKCSFTAYTVHSYRFILDIIYKNISECTHSSADSHPPSSSRLSLWSVPACSGLSPGPAEPLQPASVSSPAPPETLSLPETHRTSLTTSLSNCVN